MVLFENREFEVYEQTRGDERTLIIIEYKVIKTEINRYAFRVKEAIPT